MKPVHWASVAGAALLLSGCASIVSKSSYPVTLDSSPSGAELKITDSNGTVMYEGSGPTTIALNSGDGYFKSAAYTVEAAMDGKTSSAELRATADAWYFGNIIFGGLIGILIVDPATGAMYQLPKSFTVTLEEEPTPTDEADEPTEGEATEEVDGDMASLQVLSIEDVPAHLRGELIRIN